MVGRLVVLEVPFAACREGGLEGQGGAVRMWCSSPGPQAQWLDLVWATGREDMGDEGRGSSQASGVGRGWTAVLMQKESPAGELPGPQKLVPWPTHKLPPPPLSSMALSVLRLLTPECGTCRGL